MPDDNWRKVRQIFDSALCFKPEERRRFVHEACGDDRTLRAEVDGLAEELLNALAKIEHLKVAARTSAFSFMHPKEAPITGPEPTGWLKPVWSAPAARIGAPSFAAFRPIHRLLVGCTIESFGGRLCSC